MTLMMRDSSATGLVISSASVYNVSTGALTRVDLPIAVFNAEAVAFDDTIVLSGG